MREIILCYTETMSNAVQTNENQSISEHFIGNQRNAPQSIEVQGNSPKLEQDRIPIGAKTDIHTVTIKEAEELFEQAEVAFSTTTIWRMCQKDKNDISRLEAIYDPLLKKILITRESIIRVIEEEIIKRNKEKKPRVAGDDRDEASGASKARAGTTEDSGAYKNLKEEHEKLRGSFQELQLENERNKGMLNVYQTNWSSLQDVISTVLDTAFNKVSGRTSLEAPREFGQGEERENHEDKEKREDESKRVFL